MKRTVLYLTKRNALFKTLIESGWGKIYHENNKHKETEVASEYINSE